VKWLIKNPAPMDERLTKWGDYHFGNSLTKYLQMLGQEVESDYYGKWYNQKKAEVTLVLRGKFRYKVKKEGFHVIWVISHPEDVSKKELNSYDLIFVASKKHAQMLESKLNRPVYPLLQCTDTELFKPTESIEAASRSDFIFVGNSRGIKRKSVFWAIKAGVPLKVWGRHWDRWIDETVLVDKYIMNHQLPGLYRRAKVTFNDHWPDMLRLGYINNRIFDALACGLPVISDFQEALEELFPGVILTYRKKKEFMDCIEQLLRSYPLVLERTQQAGKEVQKNHSFRNRAKVLVELVGQHYA